MIHLLYIDPGTGSLFYQAILSALLTVSIFYGRIKAFLFTILKKRKAQDNLNSQD